MCKSRLTPSEKILKLMLSGKPVFKDDFPKIFGESFLMYKVSAYMLMIKGATKSAIRVVKNGRRVVSYQLVEPEKGIQYLKRIKKYDIVVPEIEKLSDLNATEEISEKLIETL